MKLTKGATLAGGRYRLGPLIGEGAMGAVYRATQMGVTLDRKVAVKVLFQHVASEVIADRFLEEARIIATLRHPSAVRLYDTFREEGDLFVVTELLRGESLQAVLIRERQLLLPQALYIAREVASALAEAHERGVIHRDVKASNVFVQPQAHRDLVKLLDWGIAKSHHTANLTMRARVVGTPKYMSPEQIQGRKVDGRADLYSLGVLLFALLAGRFPFPGNNVERLSAAHLDEPAPQLRSLPQTEDLPRGVEELVGDLLAKSPESRPASALETVARLDELRGYPVDYSPTSMVMR